MPEYVKDIRYYKLSERIEVPPVEYPRVLKDSSILHNDSLMAVYTRDAEGHFINTDLYKKEPWAYQHKPYNYYVSILKMYFPEQYATLPKKFLQENL
jgi:hypothetical protein